MSASGYFDYQWNFPTTGIALALEGLAALRAVLGLDVDAMPGNALGDLRDANGDIFVPPVTSIGGPPPSMAGIWIGRPGTAAYSVQDPWTGRVTEFPAKGDPSRYYMHFRTTQDAPGFDPAAYGWVPTDPAESAAVLGVWAGDDAS